MARNKINPDPPLPAPEPMSPLKHIIVFIVGMGLLIAIICFPFFQDMNSKDYQITSLVSANTTPQMWIISFHYRLNEDFPIVDYTHFQVLLYYIHNDRNNNSYSNYNNSGNLPESTLIAQSNNLIKQGQWVTTDLVMLHPPSALATTPSSLDVPFQVEISFQYSFYTKDEIHEISCTYVTMVSDNVTGSWLTALDLPKYC